MSPTHDADVITIAQAVWSSILAEELSPVVERAPFVTSSVTGVVLLEGEWSGALMLQCDSGLAANLTANMFGIDGESAKSDIRDAIGELTNMLAGNISSVLPQPCRIGLPVVAFGSDYGVQILGTNPESIVGFWCQELPVTVTLLRRTPTDTEEGP